MSKDRLLVQIASYNTNLQAERGLPQDLVDWLSPTLQVSSFLTQSPRAPDIVAVGFQELLPLHLGLAGISKGVIESRDKLILSEIQRFAPNGESYTLIAKVVNVGVALLVYGKDDGVGSRVQDVQTQWAGCGPMRMGNKGAVGVRFRVPSEDGGLGEVFTFVNAHLAAHTEQNQRRVEDYHSIVNSLLFPPLPGSNSKTPTTIFSSSHVFFFGDLNFRLDGIPFEILPDHSKLAHGVAELLRDETRPKLKEYDQLVSVRDQLGTAFVGFREGEFWQFKCSFKYQLGEIDQYDPKRVPAWTDRIMYISHPDSPDTLQTSSITNVLYTSIPSYTTSDHKPVISVLLLPPSDTSTDSIPLVKLPSTYTPHPDPHARIKRILGRIFDRILGYTWWLLAFLGFGSAAVGLSNFIFSFGALKLYQQFGASLRSAR